MWKKTVRVADVIGLLNELHRSDPAAMQALVEARVCCNEKIADHPSVQTAYATDGSFRFGVLGVLNGAFGANRDGNGQIAAFYDKGQLTGFGLWSKNQ